MTGLIAGSMAPDFEYFIRMRDEGFYGHNWIGLFWFDLPLAILLSFLFHLVVRNSLFDNLPSFLGRRLVVYKIFNWPGYFKAHFVVVICSVIIGVASHLIWDDFTHAHAVFVDMFSILHKSVHLGKHHVPLFALMQYLGSVAGLILIYIALLTLPKDGSYRKSGSIFPYWIAVSIITIITVFMRYLLGPRPRGLDDPIVILISGGLLALITVPVINYYYSQKMAEKENKNISS